jgi:hypothetical protein
MQGVSLSTPPAVWTCRVYPFPPRQQYGRVGCIPPPPPAIGQCRMRLFPHSTANSKAVQGVSLSTPPAVWTCRVYPFPPPPAVWMCRVYPLPPCQQYGRAGWIPFLPASSMDEQGGSLSTPPAVCMCRASSMDGRVYPFPPRQQFGCAGPAVWTAVCIPFHPASSIDVQGQQYGRQGVSLSTPPAVWMCRASSMDVQGVSLSTASSTDVQGQQYGRQGVSLSTARSTDVQSVSLSTAISMNVHSVPFQLPAMGTCRVYPCYHLWFAMLTCRVHIRVQRF